MTETKSSESRRKLLKSIPPLINGLHLPAMNRMTAIIAGISCLFVFPAQAVVTVSTASQLISAITGIFLTTETIDTNLGVLAVAVCSDVDVASITGAVGSILVNESGIAVPGSTEIIDGGVTATIGLLSVTGTAPNRQLTVSVQLTGTVVFGPQNLTSPESSQPCPA